MTKKNYYVTWNSGDSIELLPIKADSRTIQYEVEADRDEYEKLKLLIGKVNEKDVMQEHIFVRPFDETADDADKEKLKSDEKELFDYIQAIGTEKTKAHFQEMN
ncbi:hypothetical protein [Salipaludibacillus sp. CF4.18]|uniref:hypothetical protein n=1 Tax=Salipaludibacillus sp. CF4.18 TaxID=3373081 RepID=UPI003EE47E99